MYLEVPMGGGSSVETTRSCEELSPTILPLPMPSCDLSVGLEETKDCSDESFQKLVQRAEALEQEGKISEAKAIYISGVRKFKKSLGENNQNTRTLVNNLALLLQKQERLEEIEPLLRHILATSRAEFGDFSESTVKTLQDLAGLLKTQRKFSEAETILCEAISCSEKVYGVTARETLLNMNSLAGILKMQGRLSDAEMTYREVLEGFRNQRSRNNTSDALSAAYNLAVIQEAQGKFGEAEILYKEALSGLNPESDIVIQQDTVATINNTTSYDQTNIEPLYRKALAEAITKNGQNHPTTLASKNNLAMLLKGTRKYDEAEVLYRCLLIISFLIMFDSHGFQFILREALEGNICALGRDHINTIICVNNLSVLLKVQGKLSEAEQFARESVRGMKLKLGSANESTVAALNNFAELLKSQGKLKEAETVYKEVLNSRKGELANHPNTMVARKGLSELYAQ